MSSSTDPTLVGDEDVAVQDARSAADPEPGVPGTASGEGLETGRLRAAVEARLFGVQTAATIGRHALLEPLGAGAMGVVYAAYDAQLDRRVAIKVLHPTAAGSPRASSRLLREAQAMAKLNHPNVIAVHDAGVADGRVFVAMEYVDGGTLEDWCEGHPPGKRARFDALLALLVQAARGLQAAHAAGLVHRDLKPSNMLVDQQGRLRVADFGLARIDSVGSGLDDDADADPVVDDGLRTRAGEIVGTPAYMAPEQFEGKPDARSDQWTWSASAWEAVYGTRPFSGTTITELLDRRQAGAPTTPPASRPEVPRWFHTVLSRGLAPRPGDRYASMGALVRDLERRRRLPRRIAAGVGIAGLAALGAWGWAQDDAPVLASGSACASLSQDMAATYDPDVARSLEAEIVREGTPGAAGRVVSALDDFSAQWVFDAQRTCGALQSEGRWVVGLAPLDQPSAAMRCFRDARTQLREVVDEVHAGADASRAVTLAQALPPLAPCRDARASAPVAGPDRREIATLVAQAALRSSAQEVEPALAYLDDAQGKLTEGSDPALASRIAHVRFSIARRLGDFGTAAKVAERALELAEQTDDAALLVESWVVLADIARIEGRTDEAAFYLARSRSLLQRTGAPQWLAAKVWRAETAWLHSTGDNARARELGARTLAAVAEAEGVDSMAYARTLEIQVEVLRGVGATAEAKAAGKRVVEAFRRHYGPEHPWTAVASMRLAGVLETLGDLEGALELYRASIPAVQRNNADPRDRIVAEFSMAQVLANLRRYEEAAEVAAVAHERATADFGPTHEITNTVRLVQGAIALDGGQPETAIEIYEGLLGSDKGNDEHALSTNAFALCVNLATAYARAERTDAALREAKRCDTLVAADLGPDPLFVASGERFLGEVYERVGRRDEARERYTRVATAFDAHAPDRAERAVAHVALAELALADGETATVPGHLAATREVLADAPDPDVETRLARVEAAFAAARR